MLTTLEKMRLGLMVADLYATALALVNACESALASGELKSSSTVLDSANKLRRQMYDLGRQLQEMSIESPALRELIVTVLNQKGIKL